MHKLMAALLVCCLLTSATVIAQTAGVKQVAARMEQLRNSLLKPDKQTLTAIANDALTYGHSTGLVEDKAAFVEDLVSGKTVFTTVSFSDQTIKITGSIALVRNHMVGATNNNNVPAKVDITVLWVWRKAKGEWLLLARQAAKLPVVN